MAVFFLCILIGLIPAMIAQKKGHSFVAWWLYGALLFIIALPHALLIRPANARQCPHCAEWIRDEAKVCKHCGRDVEPVTSGAERKYSWQD